jgi:hypothetical protein
MCATNLLFERTHIPPRKYGRLCGQLHQPRAYLFRPFREVDEALAVMLQ